MTSAPDVTCYPGMGCHQADCDTNSRCYTGPFAMSEPLLTETQCSQLGISPARAAQAAAWARTYGPLTDDQRDRLRAVLHPHGNRG